MYVWLICVKMAVIPKWFVQSFCNTSQSWSFTLQSHLNSFFHYYGYRWKIKSVSLSKYLGPNCIFNGCMQPWISLPIITVTAVIGWSYVFRNISSSLWWWLCFFHTRQRSQAIFSHTKQHLDSLICTPTLSREERTNKKSRTVQLPVFPILHSLSTMLHFCLTMR